MTLGFSFFCEYIPRKFTLVGAHLGLLHCQIKSILSENTIQIYIYWTKTHQWWRSGSLSHSFSAVVELSQNCSWPQLCTCPCRFLWLDWSVVRPPSLLLYWVWDRPSGKARPSWYHVTVVFFRNQLSNSTVNVKGRLPLISWNGGGWEVMAGGTGGREKKEGGKRREEERGSGDQGEWRK